MVDIVADASPPSVPSSLEVCRGGSGSAKSSKESFSSKKKRSTSPPGTMSFKSWESVDLAALSRLNLL
jgi:hypothetical protein